MCGEAIVRRTRQQSFACEICRRSENQSTEKKTNLLRKNTCLKFVRVRKSLAFLGFDFQHAVIKLPNKSNADEFRCNESLGGTVEIYEPSKEELEYSANLLKSLRIIWLPNSLQQN